ncbi:MAG: endo alpha-1,4 polygalactosaminidase [Thermoplasmata archaeon]
MQVNRKNTMEVIIIIVLIITAFIIYTNILYETPSKKPVITSDPISGVKNFAVYYGYNINNTVLNYLNKFNMVIVQPDAFSLSNISSLSPIKIAYIDLGEYDGTCLGNFTINASKIAIGYDSQWNQTIVNASSNLWNEYILNMVNQSLKLGFNGVIFDDLDVVEQYPWEYNSLVDIISNVSHTFPHLIIGVNRGFEMLKSLTNYVNFVLYEDFGSYYNFSTDSYQIMNASQIDNLTYNLEMIHSLKMKVFGLGYSLSPNDYIYNYDLELGNANNIPVYIGNITLSSLW